MSVSIRIRVKWRGTESARKMERVRERGQAERVENRDGDLELDVLAICVYVCGGGVFGQSSN